MKIGLVGLGKMGLMLAQNLKGHAIPVIGYDVVRSGQAFYEGIELASSLEDLTKKLQDRKVVWMMLPAGEVTENVFGQLLDLCQAGDIIIDGGNSHYQDSLRRYELAQAKQIDFLDVGTSGGVSGARHGACMMVGGNAEAYAYLENVLSAINVEGGVLYCGAAGSGHYLKMVHNGIEYGMMQSIAEGFNLLRHSRYDYELQKVAHLFNHGSVIRGWLMELTENLLKGDDSLQEIEGVARSSGEGTWTVDEALRLKVSVPVIAQSVFVRFASEDDEKYGEKVIASLRNQFGGHQVGRTHGK